MRNAFDYDLGVFNPTFPGIKLYYANESVYRQTQAANDLLMVVNLQHMLRADPTLDPKKVTAQQIFDYSKNQLNFAMPMDPAGKDRLGKAFIDSDPAGAAGNLAAASAQVHERRHFHDWLVSPYTAAINAIRAEVGLNYLSLRPYLRGPNVTVIPVPLPRWTRKTDAEQSDIIEMWQSLLGDAVKVQLPDLKHPEVAAAIAGIEQRYQSIGGLFQPVGTTKLDAGAVFEASALLIQTQTLNDTLGETAGQLFLNAMMQGQAGRYTQVLQVFSSIRPAEVLENKVMSTLVTWCLLGNSTVDRDNAHPVVRMNHVVRYLQKCGFPNVRTRAHEVFLAIERFCHCVPYTQLLAQSVTMADTVEAFVVKAAGDKPSNMMAGLVQTYSFLAECHKYMASVFLKDPDSYADPVAYLDRAMEKWPEPPVMYAYGQPFYGVNRSDLSRYQGTAVFEEAGNDKQVFLRHQIVPGRDDVIDLQLADNWQFLCAMMDTDFAEYNRDQPEIDYQRELAKGEGIYLLEVLD